MGVLSNIKDKLFGNKAAAEPAKTTNTVQSATNVSNAAPVVVNTPPPAPAPAPEPVDVEAILEAAVKAKGIKLNWRVSIVDLMRALDLDSSLAARKELAAELNYTGTAADGSYEKNVWLHKTLMKTLAENGGKVPKELLG